MKAFLAVCLLVSLAFAKDETPLHPDVHKQYKKYSAECSEESQVDGDKFVKDLFNNKLEKTDAIVGHLTCFLKKIGALDEEGKVSKEGLRKSLENGKETEKNIKKIIEECTKNKDAEAWEVNSCWGKYKSRVVES